MTYDVLIALATFALVTSATPGPNNLMLMASGANFGFRRTIPHMLGIGIGFTLMVAVVGLGLAGMFDAWPALHTVLKGASVLYLLWLALKIANASAPAGAGVSAGGRPFTFLEAAGFQWVNPKAWAMALTAVTVYAPGREVWAVLLVAVIFGAINLPSVSTWTIAGQAIRRWLTNPGRLRVFNLTMALLLVLSLVPMLV
ncbi:LysE family translocator [Ovoidimarina sediminis]|uniref:LysE family translocator n=1 Tax=Ovoidimarina sediminis TaxID=3079856 RepID=UPI0029109F83|nr:LysE family translocator [Rhodophyticola sp. MJ-SS7]MDU8945904.1 LysE family translocator [Rhodophyticola sp. MJ-SS7]